MKAKNLLSILTAIIFLVTILFTLTTCKKKEEDPPPANDEFVIAPNAKFIVDNDWQSMIKIVDSTNYTLTFDNALLSKYTLAKGDLVVSTVGNGLLRKVETITQSGNNVEIQTSQATLVDLIQQGTVDFKGSLSLSKIKSITYYFPGISLDTVSIKSPDGTLFKWDINTEIAPLIMLQGNFQYTSDFILQIQVNILEGLKKVKFGFEGSEAFNLALVAGKQFNLTKGVTLATVDFAPFVILLGIPPFAIVVAPVLDIKLGLNGYANANISTTLSQNFTIGTGIQYLKGSGWSSYLDTVKSLKYTPPQLTMNAGAEAYIKPELRMLIFNLVGPFVNGKGYGRIAADLTQTPWWKMYYGFKMAAGVKAEILGKLLFDFSVDDLLIWEKQVGQSTITPPTVTTTGVTNITETTATCGGNVTDQGSSPVTARGVCWSTSPNPTISGAHTNDGSGTGAFTSNLTGLTKSTPYYVRAYATNSAGPGYGSEVSFTTTSSGIPTVTTASITNITDTSAIGGGDVTGEGGSPVTVRGVCWSTSEDPTISDAHTTDGSGTGSFTSTITGFDVNTPYYVKAYATNSAGTAYGDPVNFTSTVGLPCPGTPTVLYEGKTYHTVQIGTQCWLKENLNVGTKIHQTGYQTNNGIIEKHCYNDLESNCDVYGGLYKWDEMMQYVTTEGAKGICPTGWHIPTDAEWTVLIIFLGDEEVAGGKMKEAGYAHWSSPNTGATNTSGFTGLPGGLRTTNNSFILLTYNGYFWSSSEGNDTGTAWCLYLDYGCINVMRTSISKPLEFSVRCLKD